MGGGVMMKLIDGIVVLFLLEISLAAPLVGAQVILPSHLYPDLLIDFKNWFVGRFDHYLLVEKPNFYMGLAWVHLLFNWPLSLASLYAFAAGKSWFSTTCLVLGVNMSTLQDAVLGEFLGFGRASTEVLILYFVFLGSAFVVVVRSATTIYFLPPQEKLDLCMHACIEERKEYLRLWARKSYLARVRISCWLRRREIHEEHGID